jgi:DNA invertase Pin-like site-specific DNA recombinase
MITRCAIYTRKSSEEGLDMAFNSLDAQREAGQDYIKSQKHQGWVAVDARYDDGGYSGGTTDRPGLQSLLRDIETGRIDVVLVYKVDRLSRSLADFARLMQTFDEHKVSFVSVTQQFNTTTSMGRLTLNMLLSFAQFEREVAGERIRDKIAATKRKGVWVCGRPPLGYRLEGSGDQRGLRIVPKEAKVVLSIFHGYLTRGSLVGVAAALNDAGHTTKRWEGGSGSRHGGRRFDAQHIYKTLTNPLYIGQIVHTRGGKTDLYPGLHEPIIERDLWDRVQTKMAKAQREVGCRWTHTHLLKGKIRTSEGSRMSPGSVQRPPPKSNPTGPTKLVRYYISQKAIKLGYGTCPIKSINAQRVDDLARALVLDHLRAVHGADLGRCDPAERDHWIREIIEAAIIAPDRVAIDLTAERAAACVAGFASDRGTQPSTKAAGRRPAAKLDPGLPTCPLTPTVEHRGRITRLTVDAVLARGDARRLLVAPNGRGLLSRRSADGAPLPDSSVVHAIGMAYVWYEELKRDGGSIRAMAKRWGASKTHVQEALKLTLLGPHELGRLLRGISSTTERPVLCHIVRNHAAAWPSPSRLARAQ